MKQDRHIFLFKKENKQASIAYNLINELQQIFYFIYLIYNLMLYNII